MSKTKQIMTINEAISAVHNLRDEYREHHERDKDHTEQVIKLNKLVENLENVKRAILA